MISMLTPAWANLGGQLEKVSNYMPLMFWMSSSATPGSTSTVSILMCPWAHTHTHLIFLLLSQLICQPIRHLSSAFWLILLYLLELTQSQRIKCLKLCLKFLSTHNLQPFCLLFNWKAYQLVTPSVSLSANRVVFCHPVFICFTMASLSVLGLKDIYTCAYVVQAICHFVFCF